MCDHKEHRYEEGAGEWVSGSKSEEEREGGGDAGDVDANIDDMMMQVRIRTLYNNARPTHPKTGRSTVERAPRAKVH